MAWKPLPRYGSAPPTPLARPLARVLRHLGVQEASTLWSLEHDWAEAVGPSVAAHAVAVTFRHRRLTVRVDDPAWGSQLRWMENDVVERLRQRAEYQSLEGLDIRVGPPSR